MSDFSVVQGRVSIKDPWALDADNDLVKQGPLYMAAAGLFRGIRYANNSLASFTTTDAVGGAFFLVPDGSVLLITDLFGSNVTGTVKTELRIDGLAVAAGLITPAAGSNSLHFSTPLVVAAGSTLSFQVNPLGGDATFFDVQAHGVLL